MIYIFTSTRCCFFHANYSFYFIQQIVCNSHNSIRFIAYNYMILFRFGYFFLQIFTLLCTKIAQMVQMSIHLLSVWKEAVFLKFSKYLNLPFDRFSNIEYHNSMPISISMYSVQVNSVFIPCHRIDLKQMLQILCFGFPFVSNKFFAFLSSCIAQIYCFIRKQAKNFLFRQKDC